MSDPCNYRLVVAGPGEDIKKLARTAIGFKSPDSWKASRKPVKLPLSFVALDNSLPTTARKRLPVKEQEPYDLTSESLVMEKNGNGYKSYSFMLNYYDPELLLIEVSKIFTRVCFILGWVAPHADQAGSELIRKGAARRYNMSGKRRSEIRASKYKEWGEDCWEADIEANWLMLDEVVSRWDTNLAKIFKSAKRQGRKRPG